MNKDSKTTKTVSVDTICAQIEQIQAKAMELIEHLQAERDELRSALARWESPDNWGAFVELLGLPENHVNKPLGVASAIALLKCERDRLRAELQSIAEYDCPGLPRHCPGCAACDARKALELKS